MNNFVKNEAILIIYGVQNQDKTSHKIIINSLASPE